MKKSEETMKSFWDEKAAENALYYVSSYNDYDKQDPAEFWRWGGILADRYLTHSGLQFRGDETVLDLGCGVGRFLPTFAGRFARVHGMDISENMIQQARANTGHLTNVELHVGSGTDLRPIASASLDFVFSYLMFQHVPDPAVVFSYIRDVSRVLREGGHFYFQVNTSPPPGLRARLRLRSRLSSLAGGGARKTSADSPGPTGLTHPAWVGSRIPAGTVRDVCDRAHLTVLSMHDEGTQYTWVLARKSAHVPGTR